MKLKHNFKKPFRYFNQYHGIYISQESKDDNYWWSDNYKKWMRIGDIDSGNYGNCCHCRSIRAFRKHLKNHKELSKNTILILSGKYVGQNVYGKI